MEDLTMEQYILGWFHAVGIILIIAMVSGLVIIIFKINKLSKKVKDLEDYHETDQKDFSINIQHIEEEINKREEIITRNIWDLQKHLESELDSRINKLENKIKK
jgi:uncharacterized protein YdeI (YjbR/CyaY-like superfamily)